MGRPARAIAPQVAETDHARREKTPLLARVTAEFDITGAMTVGNAVLSTAVASAGAANLEDLSASAIPHVRSLTGAAHVSLYRYAAPGQLSLFSSELRELVGSRYTADLYGLDPTHRFASRLPPEPRVVHVSRLVGEAWRDNAAYHDFYRCFGMDHVVCTWLTRASYGQPGFVGIFMTRTPRQGDFSARDLANLRTALPALTGAVDRGLDSEARGFERDTLEAILSGDTQRPAVAFDLRGKLLWCAPNAATALGPIPDDLLQAVRRLGEVARGRDADLPILALHCRAGKQTVRVDLRLVPTKRGENVIVATLDFALPESESAARLSRQHGLTVAETRVLAWMLSGLSNSAIAERLGVSLETVRTHSKRVLGKLGVESRLQAVMLARATPPTR
jgi:DNA-binding CsgD family transcriptional regulator